MTDLDPIVILEDAEFQALLRDAPAWSHQVLARLAAFILARAASQLPAGTDWLHMDYGHDGQVLQCDVLAKLHRPGLPVTEQTASMPPVQPPMPPANVDVSEDQIPLSAIDRTRAEIAQLREALNASNESDALARAELSIAKSALVEARSVIVTLKAHIAQHPVDFGDLRRSLADISGIPMMAVGVDEHLAKIKTDLADERVTVEYRSAVVATLGQDLAAANERAERLQMAHRAAHDAQRGAEAQRDRALADLAAVKRAYDDMAQRRNVKEESCLREMSRAAKAEADLTAANERAEAEMQHANEWSRKAHAARAEADALRADVAALKVSPGMVAK